MTTKVRTFFACQACGFESSKWLGRCPDCGEWNSLAEERQEVAAPGKARQSTLALEPGAGAVPWEAVEVGEASRIPSGIGEFDRVLGGGIVPGSMVLIGGEPGIGKSTLILQVAHLLGRTHGTVLYVSGEESERQVKLRGERLGIAGGAGTGGVVLHAVALALVYVAAILSLRSGAADDLLAHAMAYVLPAQGVGALARRWRSERPATPPCSHAWRSGTPAWRRATSW